MGIADLSGARAKLGRANEHFQAVNEEIMRLATDRTQAGVIYCRRENGWYVVQIESFPPLPLRLSLIIGDCLNNLRTALDHLVWQLVLREDEKPTHTHGFPITKTLQEFLDKCKTPAQQGKKGHPLYGIPVGGDAWAIVEAAQPFRRPEPQVDPLALLAKLNNIDKHNTLLVQQAIVNVQSVLESIFWGTQEQPIERVIHADYVPAEHPTEIARFRFAAGTQVPVQMDIHPAVEITVGDGKTYMMLGRLSLMTSYVEQILDQAATLPRVQG